MKKYAAELSDLLETMNKCDIQIDDYKETKYATVVYFTLKTKNHICFGVNVENNEFELFIENFSYGPDYVEHIFTEEKKK